MFEPSEIFEQSVILAIWNGYLDYDISLLHLNKRIRSEAIKQYKTEYAIHLVVKKGFLDGESVIRLVSKPIHDFCGCMKLNFMGDTALMAACSYRSSTTKKVSVVSGRLQSLLSIPSYKTSLNMQSIYGYTALHNSCQHFPVDISMVRMLLDAKADVNHRTLTSGPVTTTSLGSDGGRTALHMLAGIRGMESAIAATCLIDRRADVNVQSNKGLTPLHIVLEHANSDLYFVLIQNDADETIEDIEGKRPLDHHLREHFGSPMSILSDLPEYSSLTI
eukprot:gene36-168_t